MGIGAKLLRLSSGDWLALGVAAKELLLARIRFSVLPSGRIVARLRDAPQGAPDAVGTCDAARVSWAINAAAARVPWRADCLLRVMAADRWLRRCGARPQFFLGVAKDGDALRAHAWLHCNGIAVTGGYGRDFEAIIQPVGETSAVAKPTAGPSPG